MSPPDFALKYLTCPHATSCPRATTFDLSPRDLDLSPRDLEIPNLSPHDFPRDFV